MKGEHKSAEYLKINPFGQVPALTDNQSTILDAQGILVYLARRYGGEEWLPLEAESLSKIIRWLSTTAGEIRQGPENARLYYLFGVKSINIERATEKAHLVLKLLNDHLSDLLWLELERPTIADIAAFPYIALAPDGKIDLSGYPMVLNWMQRIKELPGFIAMGS